MQLFERAHESGINRKEYARADERESETPATATVSRLLVVLHSFAARLPLILGRSLGCDDNTERLDVYGVDADRCCHLLINTVLPLDASPSRFSCRGAPGVLPFMFPGYMVSLDNEERE